MIEDKKPSKNKTNVRLSAIKAKSANLDDKPYSFLKNKFFLN